MMNAITINLAAQINDAHRACERAVRDGLGHAIEAGNLLIEVKKQVGHGGFLDWLKSNIDFSERTARGYMRVARNRQRVADMSLRDALKSLAEPSRRADDPVAVQHDDEAAEIEMHLARQPTMRSEALSMLTGGRPPIDPPGAGCALYAASGRYTCWIMPAVQEGFYHIATTFSHNPDGTGGVFVEGTKKPIRGDGLRHFIEGTIFRSELSGVTWETIDWAEPCTFNLWLFHSHQHYVDEVILGKAVS